MENVICSCGKCGEELGYFRNAWNGIGNTYISPIYPPASALDGFVPTNSIYKGAEHTQIENSYLQDITCKGCGAVLGLRCDSAPEGHLLKRNQLILRLAEMSLISERTGHKATASVVERFSLTLPGSTKPPRSGRASTAQPSYRAGTPSLNNHRHALNSILAPISDDKQLRELERFKVWAKSAIQTQQNDIDRIGGAFDRMERDMNSFKAFMEEVRAELATYRQFQDSLKDGELGIIKQELNDIRAELNANRQFKNSLREEEFPVLQEDIDALRSELAQARHFQQELKHQDIKILQQGVDSLRQNMEGMAYLTGNEPKVPYQKFETLVGEVREVDRKASEIYSLRTELEQFKTRLAFMETSCRETMPFQGAPILEHVSNKAAETISHNESGNSAPETSQLSIRKGLQRVDPSSYKQGEGCQSLPKRRRFQAEDDTDTTFDPPAKRPMYSATQATSILSSGNASSKSLTVRFHTEGSPIDLSSNHGTPSPILDKPSAHSTRNRGDVLKGTASGPIQFNDLPDLHDKSRPTRKSLATGNITSSTAQLPTGTPNHVLKRAIGNSVGKESTGMQLRHQEHNSAHLDSDQKSGERSHKALRASSSKENRNPRHLRERSDTPDQLSTVSANEAMQKSVQKRRLPGRPPKVRNGNIFGKEAVASIDSDSPLPSIEKETGQRVTRAPALAPSITSSQPVTSIAADPERPFACDECGKTYKFVANLERHMVISSRCRVGDKAVGRSQNTDVEIVKKRKMRERERLATELLARQ